MKKLLLLTIIFLFSVGSLIASSKDPVGVLFQVKGKVEYTKNGKRWKKVRRNKFLFAGYQVRTGPGASGKVTIQATGEGLELAPNSVIKVTKNGLQAQKGVISNAESSSKLMQGLMKKFTRSQSYTTVRRSHEKKTLKLSAARELSLSDDHPYLVWANIGSDYSYRLNMGDKTYQVPATTNDVVRVRVEPFTGSQTYKIEALKGGKVAVSLKPYSKRGQKTMHSASWMSTSERDRFQNDVKNIQETYGEISFMLGSFFEKQDMWVAAMDQYREYLKENPEEIEMSPYLFRVYKKLRLDKIYKQELASWKKAMQE
jgi:hypothetical protein